LARRRATAAFPAPDWRASIAERIAGAAAVVAGAMESADRWTGASSCSPPHVPPHPQAPPQLERWTRNPPSIELRARLPIDGATAGCNTTFGRTGAS
jgi:hypothetical protein